MTDSHNNTSIAAEATVETTRTTLVEEPGAIPEKWISLSFTWAGKPFTLQIAETDRVFDFKTMLHNLTKVPPERQKILGLIKGKLPSDEVLIQDLKLVPGKKFTLVGTPQGDEIKDPSQLEFLPDVVNDLDVDFSADPAAAAAYVNDQRNLRKIKEHTQKLEINVMYPLREGKRLLVLDIDYTILDTKPLTSGALPPQECARPRLHEFLEAVYPYYDICIWILLIQGRNFALNPNQGLKIPAFKDAHTPHSMADRELDKVARYMVHIASTHDDFSILNHKVSISKQSDVHVLIHLSGLEGCRS
ncbi:hypothetical protein PHLCEN_2v5843 [Hermanssonia centrifuga]|uniref:Ubiquitin-like domain-containing protein n=1 Tax=Hermanssonia centrifuga TaxID=98765 RepID=A0A2R6P136_9APHY|nr:hypothetical protein PHLCEN_2v5843 [Hermanssonia centrifuga]